MNLYATATKGREYAVRDALRAEGHAAWIAEQGEWCRKQGQRERAFHKRPEWQYVFIQANPRTWHLRPFIKGLTGNIEYVTERTWQREFVPFMKDTEEKLRLASLDPESEPFKPGEALRIRHGQLEGRLAEFEKSIERGETIKVEVRGEFMAFPAIVSLRDVERA
jgi:transcription antitermination factor NusG